MKFSYGFITLVVVIIVAFILLAYVYACYPSTEGFKDGAESGSGSENATVAEYKKRSGNTTTFYHLPYTYTYAANGGRPLDEEFLAFMCLRFPERSMGDWTTGYNNPLQLVKDCVEGDSCLISDPDFTLQCKTSKVFDLDDRDPIKDAVNKVRVDVKQSMNAYAKEGIMAPVYMLVVQYPKKYDFDDYGNEGYHYSQFDVEDNNAKPCETRNISKGTKEICNAVDTKMMLIYPMYSKETGKHYNYGVRDNTYNISAGEGGTEGTGRSGGTDKKVPPNVKGIVDMVKFFGRYANKNALCFIECNNNPSLFCGCATRKDGVDDPREDKGEYKSFCKMPFDKDDAENTEDKFAHYAWMYRVNERSSAFKDIITDVNIDHNVEKKINHHLQ